MRMEEMKFIDIEATAHLDGVAAGVTALKHFINTYRYTDNSYQANNATTMEGLYQRTYDTETHRVLGRGNHLL